MTLQFDVDCQKAVDVAKGCVREDGVLTVGVLLNALFHSPAIRERFPQIEEFFPQPQVTRNTSEQVPLSDELKPVLTRLNANAGEISAEVLFVALMTSTAGRQELAERGVVPELIDEIVATLKPQLPWRQSPQRQEALEALSSYGRMLTDTEPPDRGRSELEGPLEALVMTLTKMKRRNAIVVGYPGTGKTALIYELARRLLTGHASIPEHLREYDIFELSPAFLRSGASVVGQYEERVKALLQVLTANPKIILFIDEIHAMFQSGVHTHGPFSDANETFKGALGHGEIICIGCTTLSEFKHFLEPDAALTRRFEIIRVQPPSEETTLRILKSRRPRVERHFAPLEIPDDVLEKTVKLTSEYLPARFEPDRSIQLIDHACAWMNFKRRGSNALTEEALINALEHTLGHKIIRPERLTDDAVYEKLSEKIRGQDPVLRQIAAAFATGMTSWRDQGGPRGVYLFGGPTGVGKTETARMLSSIFGSDKEALIRVDCNLLQGSGIDGGPIRNLLLGVPRGYVGYARGEGGILTRVRDEPESIVLFDEFEKADPTVSELLLNIIDDGEAEDVDGNLLNFRRCYLVFTTNAGVEYDDGQLGFLSTREGSVPTVNRQHMEQILMRRLGVGPEFLGRFTHVFLFQGLTRDVIEEIVGNQLERLSKMADLRGKDLSWEGGIARHLAERWQPRFGVRYLTTILRNRVIEQLGMAEAAGELDEVSRIRLTTNARDAEGVPGAATRTVDGNTLIISIA